MKLLSSPVRWVGERNLREKYLKTIMDRTTLFAWLHEGEISYLISIG